LYFLNAKKLRRDLRQGSLSSFDVAAYLFLVIGFQVPIWYPAPDLGSVSDMQLLSWVRVASGLISPVITFLGLRSCYLANGGLDGSSLAERYVSLGWVLAFRISLVALPPYVAAIHYFPIEPTRFWPPFAVGIHALFYWLLVRQFRRLNAVPEHAA
jgi:hypothetical protein